MDAVKLFSEPTQGWLEERWGSLQAAALAAYPGPGLEQAGRTRLAWRVAGPFQAQLPRVGGARLGRPFDAAALPRGVPGPRPEPLWKVPVRLAVDGDASLLVLRPAGLAAAGAPPGEVRGGEVVLDFIEDGLRQEHVEAWRAAVGHYADSLTRELYANFFGQLLGRVFQAWDDRTRADAEARHQAARRAERLRRLGYPVG